MDVRISMHVCEGVVILVNIRVAQIQGHGLGTVAASPVRALYFVPFWGQLLRVAYALCIHCCEYSRFPNSRYGIAQAVESDPSETLLYLGILTCTVYGQGSTMVRRVSVHYIW